MAKRIDLTNRRFGRLTVIEYSYTANGKACWYCKCDCGGSVVVRGSDLKAGKTKSCGCLHDERSRKMGKANKHDLTGKRFGKLTVFRDTGERQGKHPMWECQCDCGNVTVVRANALTSGTTVSCGCWRKERATGPNHHNWNGGISPEYKKARASMGYLYWKKAVFKKFNNTCQICGSRRTRLQAHHLESFHNNPEFRTKVENGVLLCIRCHKDFHHQYGWGNNTKEQFEEFKSRIAKERVTR